MCVYQFRRIVWGRLSFVSTSLLYLPWFIYVHKMLICILLLFFSLLYSFTFILFLQQHQLQKMSIWLLTFSCCFHIPWLSCRYSCLYCFCNVFLLSFAHYLLVRSYVFFITDFFPYFLLLYILKCVARLVIFFVFWVFVSHFVFVCFMLVFYNIFFYFIGCFLFIYFSFFQFFF